MISMSSISLIYMIGAYLVGALPVGYWISKWAGIQDIRRHGSGNIGATNVARVLGLKYFFIVLAADCFKAYLYLVLCADLGALPMLLMLCAFLLLIGNGHSIFLSGSGGKGVATMVGILLAMHPLLLLGLLSTWLFALRYLRDVGIASVVTSLAVPWYALILSGFYGFLLVAGMAAWVLWRHRDNIRIFYMVR
jgi:glycerol-3-phosphate acyltransferase PlsY